MFWKNEKRGSHSETSSATPETLYCGETGSLNSALTSFRCHEMGQKSTLKKTKNKRKHSFQIMLKCQNSFFWSKSL